MCDLVLNMSLSFCSVFPRKKVFFNKRNQFPCKHITCIPRWNSVESTVSTLFQRGIHVMCYSIFSRPSWSYRDVITTLPNIYNCDFCQNSFKIVYYFHRKAPWQALNRVLNTFLSYSYFTSNFLYFCFR